ncbi:hypothetical protein [Sphingobacterium sp.]|uniref:hypothetical protein n=1 Tax=Sphingobacterium sp. TaxID=341027 RepID=UPI0031DED6F5
MNKLHLVLLISATTLVYSPDSSAQTNCDAIKKENAELKKALGLNEPIITEKKGDLEYTITKVEGNTKSQSVTIEVNIKNSGKNLESFTTEVKSVLDPNGNEYKLKKAYIGATDATYSAYTTLYRDAPLKCKYIFNGIQPEVKLIKLLNFPVRYHVPGTNSFDFQVESVEFRDFKITWK